jgi:hypothetical protein
MVCMSCIWIPKPTNTHSEYVILLAFCFSTATVVAQTCLSVMFYVHCLSCLEYFHGVTLNILLQCSTILTLFIHTRPSRQQGLLSWNNGEVS